MEINSMEVCISGKIDKFRTHFIIYLRKNRRQQQQHHHQAHINGISQRQVTESLFYFLHSVHTNTLCYPSPGSTMSARCIIPHDNERRV